MSGIPAGAGSLLGKRLGKYEILALLALGGTAEIYLARIGGAAGFEKYVVVKCLHDHLNDDQDFVKMFLDEARIAANLDHSNIVQTMELGEHEGRYFMVMEFLAGLSLAMMVRRVGERVPTGRIPVPITLNMLAQSCAGLHYAHERVVNGKNLGIVHRDISPQNIVVSFEGVAKVVDFGIAKADERETKTKSGTIKGKFAYMSPEQCVAQNVDRRTDVFALGVILHELLTGKRLFKRNSPYETYQAVIDCNVPTPSKLNHELDPALDAIVLKALAKDKDARYPTAEALGDALLGYLHHRGKGSGPGDVSRFFDQYFGQEIEEHGNRMRDLIQGRVESVDAPLGWGEEDDKKRNMTVDLGGRASSGSLSDVIDDLGAGKSNDASLDEHWDDVDGNDTSDDEGEPAEKTRIESNPLEKLAEMNKQSAKPAAAKPAAPLPSITGKPAIPRIPIPSLGVPRSSPKAPTQPPPIAQPNRKAPPSGPLPLPPAPTPRAANPTPPAGNAKFPSLANLPTMIAELDESSEHGQAAPAPELQNTQIAPPILPPSASTRPATADRFEAEAPTQEASAYQGSPAMMGLQTLGAQMGIPPPSPYEAAPQPYHPSGYPQAQTMPFDSGQYPSPDPNLISPVGPGYPPVDWSAAAQAPGRAIPKWVLAVMFVGAIGLALALTIIIAKLAR